MVVERPQMVLLRLSNEDKQKGGFMKFNKTTALMLALIAMPALANAANPSTAGQLALHRIEKLVQLNRIDVSYIKNFDSITVETLTQNVPTDPAFKEVVSQARQDAQTAPPQVELLSNSDAKVLSHRVVAGVAGAGLSWPQKDPLSIAESAFHYIEEHSAHQPQLTVFDVGFKSIAVTQDTRNGALVGIVNVMSNQLAQTLEFVIGLDDGVVRSWSLK